MLRSLPVKAGNWWICHAKHHLLEYKKEGLHQTLPLLWHLEDISYYFTLYTFWPITAVMPTSFMKA
jgi:hypothetical protein